KSTGAIVEVCGGLALRRPDGSRADALLGGRRGEQAFAYLVLHRERAVSRESLAEMLWGEAPPATWASALRTVLGHVRRACDALGAPDALAATRGLVQLVLPDSVAIDLEHARTRLRAAELDPSVPGALADARDAVAILGAPVLPGIDADWVDGV